MRTIETAEQSGPDGKLRIEIPVDKVGQTYRVVVVIEEEPAPGTGAADQWPPGYIDSTAGAWQGDFTRLSEGPFEERERL
jgi:hypothetical protein